MLGNVLCTCVGIADRYSLSLGDLNANRPVPFRLTPNIAEFLTPILIAGPLTASMVAAARCFVYPPYKLSSYLSAILRDEYITWHKKVKFLHCLLGNAVLWFHCATILCCSGTTKVQSLHFVMDVTSCVCW